MSSTISYENPPLFTQDVLNQQAKFLVSNNQYSTTQSFFGIENGSFQNIAGPLQVTGVSHLLGAVSCASTLNVVGASTLGPVTCSSLVISGDGADLGLFSTQTFYVTGASTLQGTLNVSQTSSFAAVNAQTVQAASIAVAGTLNVSQASTFNGIAAQSVQAASIAVAGAATCASTLNVGGPIVASSVILSGGLTCSSIVDTGPLTCTTMTASGLLRGDTNLAVAGSASIGTSVGCASLTTSGLLNVGTNAVVSGTLTVNGNSNLNNIFYPFTQNTLTYLANVPLNLGFFSQQNPFILTAVAGTNWQDLTITNGVINAEFDIFFIGPPTGSVTITKALSSGTVTIYNNLSGNTSVPANNRFWIQGRMVSATVCYLHFLNIT